MALYACIWAALFAMSAVTTLAAGANLVGIALFPIPVGVYIARRKNGLAAGLIAAAVLSAFLAIVARAGLVAMFAGNASGRLYGREIGAFALLVSVYYGLNAAAGLPLGIGVVRGWSYGRVVAAVSAVVFLVALANHLATWDTWLTQTRALFDDFAATLRTQLEETGGERQLQQLELLAWFKGELPAFALGTTFGGSLVAACLAVTITASGMRRFFGEPGPVGSFKDMRPSEWLVWGAIVVALACFVDYRWPEFGIRLVAWNVAVGLGVVYWLNGLAILMYGMHALQPGVLATFIVALLVYTTGVIPMLWFFGLFDTWGDFRRKLDTIAAARAARSGSGDDEPKV
jgi:uncharacterized protein YybS (DUF2232 family)